MPASFASMQFESDSRPFGNPLRFKSLGNRLSYDFLRRWGEKGPLGEGGSPLVSGEGRIEKPQTS
jgi:hypothetical protein